MLPQRFWAIADLRYQQYQLLSFHSLAQKLNALACDGTGFPKVPTGPGRKIYPAPCKQCFGKGRMASIAMLRGVGGDGA
jgi:hypothetical protein